MGMEGKRKIAAVVVPKYTGMWGVWRSREKETVRIHFLHLSWETA